MTHSRDLDWVVSMARRFEAPDHWLFDELVSAGTLAAHREMEKSTGQHRIAARQAMKKVFMTHAAPVSFSATTWRRVRPSYIAEPYEDCRRPLVAKPATPESQIARLGTVQDQWDDEIIAIVCAAVPKQRDQDVIIYRAGLNGKGCLSVNETAELFDLTPRRVNQIFAEGLRRIAAHRGQSVPRRHGAA